jgi:ATP-dependent Zn protease
MGPMLLMGISQIRGFEPGDAQWGVKLEDVRGQVEAKEEIRRVVNLWQSGEAFERAGGKRERGLLFLGAPGTGKTMLAKAIATGFNSPFVSIPGSGFAQTFIGIDAIIVRFLSRKAKKMARKWGGTCIVFIDEIDAVGMRRQALQGGGGGRWEPPAMTPQSITDICFHGPNGALTGSGDVVIESRAWRDRLFTERYPPRPQRGPGFYGRIMEQAFPGMMGGGMGQLALNQLLVTMDGMDNPPFFRRVFVNRLNTLMDAIYIVPRRVGKLSFRLPPPRPRKEQVYFIGATNVQLEVLDPALTRPGRMGRHVWFRTPTKEDRKDIFDLYLGKVSHEPELDTAEARDELARMTNGYSPAMIDQVCSMALTYAQHDGRMQFARADLVEAMTTIESGTAIGIEYVPEEARAVAIHEAGHAITSHLFQKNTEATRLSTRMRGGSLGHFYGIEKEERFGRWRSEDMATLTTILGAMAAEHVFYGENGNGVGGDVQTATAIAAYMVGASGMGPEPLKLNGSFADETPEETEKRIRERLQKIGLQIMNRTSGGGPMAADPIASVLGDPDKRKNAAEILGQAYIRAYNTLAQNKPGVEHITSVVMDKRELYGDEVVRLLEDSNLKQPEYDLLDEKSWPTI